MADTNIGEEHRRAFEALTSGSYENLALFSCFVNNEPASAIVSIQPPGANGEDEYVIRPLFVSVTSDMVLTDHEGCAA